MADSLDFKMARELASRLSLIDNFPRQEQAVLATAEDFGKWCKGAVLDGRLWSAEAQAEWLVNEVRNTWDRWKGTSALRQVFQAKFERQKLAPSGFDKKKWEEEYGPPDPGWADRLLKVGASTGNKHKDFLNQMQAVKYQSIRDSLYYTEGKGRFIIEIEHGDSDKVQSGKRFDQGFWREAMNGHNKKNPDLVAFFRKAIADGRLDAVPPEPNFDPGGSDKPHSLTRAEFEAMSPAVPETPTARCQECGGSGRLAGDEYCTCRMGRDLYRVETGRKS